MRLSTISLFIVHSCLFFCGVPNQVIASYLFTYLTILIWRVSSTSWIQVLGQTYVLWIPPTSLWVIFPFSCLSMSRTFFLFWWWLIYLYFFFCFCPFPFYLTNIWLLQVHKDILLCFLIEVLILLAFSFMSVVHVHKAL